MTQQDQNPQGRSFRVTSIKTRIETNFTIISGIILYTFRVTSIKTRIET